MAARKGKIARLSYALREELNLRLHDNQDGGRICAWLNEAAKLRGPAAITSQNLSEWRSGGFADWLGKQDKIERTQRLAEFCLRTATAGGGSMDLPAAIAGGQLMEILEEFDPSNIKTLLDEKPETWLSVIEMLSKLQRSKADEVTTRQNDVRLKQSDRKLALEEARFQRQTCELFLKWYNDKRAAEIAADKALKPDVKIAELRQLMFGPIDEEASNG